MNATATKPSWAALQRAAREQFGVERFRPGQRELIACALDGRHSLGIMPTGAGKSLCFQLPAQFLAGTTVVVSPLLALMQDQLEKMSAAGVEAATIDSILAEGEKAAALRLAGKGKVDLVYVTPEQLQKTEQRALFKTASVALVVVDEAHCISQWGHDFRPAYLAVRDAIRELGNPPVMALTATATPSVIADVLKQLGVERAEVVSLGIDRPNLDLEVRRTGNEDAKREEILDVLAVERGRSGIIYTATVKSCDEVHAWLESAGHKVGLYHGRLKAADRELTQQRFMTGELGVVVATTAFGLGIDKPDVRFVLHYQFPDSLESYYQEIGRAGRDGKTARAILLYRLEDKRVQSCFLGGKYPSRVDVRRVIGVLRAASAANSVATEGLSIDTIAMQAELSIKRARVVVALLDGAGLVERRRVVRLANDLPPPELEEVLGDYEMRQAGDRDRLEEMMGYAQTSQCRYRFLKRYFHEDDGEDCGHCDNCRGLRQEELQSAPWTRSSAAAHKDLHLKS